MSKWREIRLGEVIEFNPKVKLKKGKRYPVIGIADISENEFNVYEKDKIIYTGQSSSKFESGDILFSRITPCLENRKIARVFLRSEKEGFGSTELFIFRGKENETLTNFISYLVQTDTIVLPAINSMSGASGRQRADGNFVKNLTVKIPDLKTQEKIAHILSAYDELIENNNRRIKILEKLAEEIYKEWFVRMRFPGYKNAKFTKGIPEGWENVKIEDICCLVRGISYSTPEITGGCGIPMLTLKSVKAFGGYDENGIKYFNGDAKERHFVKDGDLLIAITDMTQDRRVIGQACQVPKNHFNKLVFSADLILFDGLRVNKSYLYSYLKYGGLSNYIAMYSNGANVLHLNQNMLKKIKFIIASEDLQNKYGAFHEKTEKMIDNLLLQNQNLTKQRNLLLPRLMNGTIEVK